MKSFMWGAAIILLVLAGAAYYLINFDQSPCYVFRKISKDAIQNERLRAELTEFINDEGNRDRLKETGRKGDAVLSESAFSSTFDWRGVFGTHRIFEDHLQSFELVLRIDGEAAEPAVPPYHIREVGVYAARTLIMFKNENKSEYHGGRGEDKLNKESYVKCNVSFKNGSPFN